MITFWRIYKSGTTSFVRHAWLSVAATAVMVVALTIMLLGFVLNTAARNAIESLSEKLKVSVYLKGETTPEQVSQLQAAFKQNQYVSSVDYTSADKAQQNFVESFRNDEKLLEGLALVGSGTFPASIDVGVGDLGKINEVAQIANQEQYKSFVDSVSLGKTDARKTIDRAVSVQRFIVVTTIMSAAIFTVVALLIIFNTIRMAIFSRNEEIAIMKLIGATRNYIRGPFIVEAASYGVLAGIIATLLAYSLIESAGVKIGSQPEFRETYELFRRTSSQVWLLLAAISAGVLIGIVSSFLAMRRYLKLNQW